VAYREMPAPPALAPYVACLWTSTGPTRRVLPDACADIVWTGRALVVAGPATRAVVPDVPPDEQKVGLRFRIGAAGLGLGMPAEELQNRTVALGDVWREGHELAERVADEADPGARLGLVVRAVAARLSEEQAPDPLVRAAVRDLARPRTRVSALGDRLSISERQLRRRLARAVGYSPRTLARVLRLQRFLILAEGHSDLARLAADAGYADQPHLTRDCFELAGLPAGALLATGAGPAGERSAFDDA
jgi:AraC-like DNA-binding protein